MADRRFTLNDDQASIIDQALRRMESMMIDRVSTNRTSYGVNTMIPDFQTTLRSVHNLREKLWKWQNPPSS